MKNRFSDRRVKDEMSRSVIFARPDDCMDEALSLMAEYQLTVLPVTDKRNRCVGIISSTDLINVRRQEPAVPFAKRSVSEFMSSRVVSIDQEMSILNAAGEMLRHRIHHLPVVDAHQQLQGIISTMDLLAALTSSLARIELENAEAT